MPKSNEVKKPSVEVISVAGCMNSSNHNVGPLT